jgi:putative DNA primase/helicase
MIDDISDRMQVPPDYVAAGAVVSLAGCVNRRATIRPKRIDTWEVTPNLWGMVVAPPGYLKSPILREVTRPLTRIEELWRETHKLASGEYAIEIEKAKLRRQAWSEAYKQAVKRDKQLPVEPDDSITPPAQKRLLIGDATFEKLHEILSENPAGVLSVRDELISWLGELEKPGRESERGFYLQAWNGDGGFSVDRIGRGTVHAPHVCLSLIGNLQPARLRNYLRDTLTGGPSDDGLIQRFQILVWPDVDATWTNVDREPNHAAILAVEKIFTKLANLSADAPIQLHFCADAQQLFDAWRAELEAKVRGECNLHAALVAHLSKYRSLFPTLAGLFELADLAVAGGDLGGEALISLDHTRQAAALCDYLESHARRVYDCMVSPEMASARELARHLSAGDLPERFSTRDVYRHGWSGLTQPEQARKALELLNDSEWVRQQEAPPSVIGGRPTEMWQINPKISRHAK